MKILNALFCDEIRFEQGNKLSLMGTYSGDIIFLSKNVSDVFPKKLRFGLFVGMECDNEQIGLPFGIVIKMGDKVVTDQQLDVITDGARLRDGALHINIAVNLTDLLVEADSYLEAVVKVGVDEFPAVTAHIKAQQTV